MARSRGARAHIPTHRDRKVQRIVDRAIYRQRNLVERFFSKLKHFSRVATRFDKLARNFLAAVLLASTRIWISAYGPRVLALQLRLDLTSESIGHHDSEDHGWREHRLRRRWSFGRHRCGM